MERRIADPELLARLVERVMETRGNPEPWMIKGACRDVPAEPGNDPWFPNTTNVQAARDICGTCPVTAECDDFATRRGFRVGIWGDKSQRSRLRTLRENKDPNE